MKVTCMCTVYKYHKKYNLPLNKKKISDRSLLGKEFLIKIKVTKVVHTLVVQTILTKQQIAYRPVVAQGHKVCL